MKFFKKLKSKIISKVAVLSVACCGLISTALASESINDVILTNEQLKPLLDGVKGNIAVLLPVGIAILAAFMGPTLIPWVVRKFKQ